MARQKEFDRDKAVRSAMLLFQKQGYGATTTEDLRLAIGIGRQSFYDTFKGKEEIYVEALRLYVSDRFSEYSEEANRSKSPLEAIEKILLKIPREGKTQRKLACLGVASACEFGDSHEAIRRINESAMTSLTALFARLLAEGQKKGEIKASLDPEAAALYLITLQSGLRVGSRGGASPEALADTIRVAIAGLKG